MSYQNHTPEDFFAGNYTTTNFQTLSGSCMSHYKVITQAVIIQTPCYEFYLPGDMGAIRGTGTGARDCGETTDDKTEVIVHANSRLNTQTVKE